MATKFRFMRLLCRIQSLEVAAEANITSQRLSQIETRYYSCKPKDPERIIRALETVLAKQKKEIERVEHICKYERDTIFDNMKAGEML